MDVPCAQAHISIIYNFSPASHDPTLKAHRLVSENRPVLSSMETAVFAFLLIFIWYVIGCILGLAYALADAIWSARESRAQEFDQEAQHETTPLIRRESPAPAPCQHDCQHDSGYITDDEFSSDDSIDDRPGA
ncbi:hypothetical protein F4819DRAFT_492291 [Hypoxylon fuscum]|nr:hypothetical protein F4819DRAFT_492291 [Hypoxylon fuscum]